MTSDAGNSTTDAEKTTRAETAAGEMADAGTTANAQGTSDAATAERGDVFLVLAVC
jgi:hypothetical protein